MSRDRHDSMPSGSGGLGGRPRPQRPRPDSDGHEDDLVDAAWLYAWSAEALCPAQERVSVPVIAPG
jgi:hypothetical protein